MITEYFKELGTHFTQESFNDSKQHLLELIVKHTNQAGVATITYNDCVKYYNQSSVEEIRIQCLELCHLYIEQEKEKVRLMNGITVNDNTIELNWSYPLHQTIWTIQQKINSRL